MSDEPSSPVPGRLHLVSVDPWGYRGRTGGALVLSVALYLCWDFRDAPILAVFAVAALAGLVLLLGFGPTRILVDPSTRRIVRRRSLFLGLVPTERVYPASAFASVVVTICRVKASDAPVEEDHFVAYYVALAGDTANLSARPFTSAFGGNPEVARDKAHVLALQLSRALALPVDIRRRGEPNFRGELSAFPESELASASPTELLAHLRTVLAARRNPVLAGRALNTLEKCEDSAVFIGAALKNRRLVLADEIPDANARAWLARAWGVGTRDLGEAFEASLHQIEQFGVPPPERNDDRASDGGFDWSEIKT